MIRHLFGNQFSGGILSETIYRTDCCTQTPATFSAALQQGNTNRYSQIRNQGMKYLTKSRTPRAIAGPFLERVAHLLEPRAKAVGPISGPLRAALIKTSFFVSCAPHLDGRTLDLNERRARVDITAICIDLVRGRGRANVRTQWRARQRGGGGAHASALAEGRRRATWPSVAGARSLSTRCFALHKVLS